MDTQNTTAGVAHSRKSTHVERMQDELAELNGRITRLDAFIAENPIFGTLGEDEQYDMHKQRQYMSEVSRVLTRRIDRATAAEAEVEDATEDAEAKVEDAVEDAEAEVNAQQGTLGEDGSTSE